MVVIISEDNTPTENSNNLRRSSRHQYTVKIDNRDDFTFTVKVTSSARQLWNWITNTKSKFASFYNNYRLVVGLGVKWTPQRNAATIQLCVGTRVLIYRLSHAYNTCPPELRSFLRDPHITFVGLWNIFDATKLRYTHRSLRFLHGMPIDLRFHLFTLFNRESLQHRSSRGIVKNIFGVEIDLDMPNADTTDWEAHQLSLDQVSRASVQAFVAYKLGLHIGAWHLNPRNFHHGYY